MSATPEIECPDCNGHGSVETGSMERGPAGVGFEAVLCEACSGTGTIKSHLMVGRPCADVAFLLEVSRYFEKRLTGGEDGAHWSNVSNAENCRRIAERLAIQSEGWRPISEAPKNGARCLFFAPANKKASNENAQIDQMRVDRKVERYGWRYAREYPEAPYSHFMPIPAPPEGEG